MKHTEGRLTGHGGLEVFHQCWLPDEGFKAILLVVPGLAEHSGRYANVVNYFVPRDYAVCSLDVRGHGRSHGLRCHVDDFLEYVDDVKRFFDIVRKEHAEAKIFLVGHSMGGAIALAYVVQHQEGLSGLLVSGAGLMAGSSFPRAIKLAVRVISMLRPKMGVSTLDATAISQDKAVVDAYVNDPLVYRGKIRARLGAELLRTVERLPSQLPEVTLPILIMHGTADRLCDPAGSQLLYDLVGSPDKTLKFYEGFHHEIFNEPGRQQVMADVEAWLAARI